MRFGLDKILKVVLLINSFSYPENKNAISAEETLDRQTAQAS